MRPKDTPEWRAAKKPIWDAFDRDTAEDWARQQRREITMVEYQAAINPVLVRTLNDLEPLWREHGGSKNPPSKTIQQHQDEWDAKWKPEPPT